MWRIKKTLLEDLCVSAEGFLPEEFICFLGGNKKTKIISEIVFLPAQTSEDSAAVFENNIPFDETIVGTVHSHPFSTNTPSEEDKRLFFKYSINIILGYPYTIQNMAFLDHKSKKIRPIIE